MSDCGNLELCRDCVAPENANLVEMNKTLRQWLTAVTCIPWYQSPPSEKEPSGQFGVVEFKGYEFGRNKRGVEGVNTETLKGCTTSTLSVQIWAQITIKGRSTFTIDGNEITRTPGDVMMDLHQAYLFDEISNSTPFPIKEWGDERNVLVNDDDKCCWHDSASLLVGFCVERQISRGEQYFNAACLKFCEGEIICPEEQEDCE